MYYSETLKLPKTDPTRWRLNTDKYGRESWQYLSTDEEVKSKPQATSYVKYLLQLEDFEGPTPEDINTPYEACVKGAEFYLLLQDENSGMFPCQYKGPMFMTIGFVVAHYVSKTPIPEPQRIEMIRYIVNTAHPVDGGWGLHSVDKSTCYGTTMNYIALRLLGMLPDHEVLVKARKTLHRLGGAIKNPHWGKAWLSILNLYDWEGVNPAPPELWLIPYSVPLHPARWWVHTRAIYLPLGYLAANKFQCKLDDLLLSIRDEIYLSHQLPYDTIDFSKHRNNVCGVDLYYPHSKVLDTANWFLVKYEKYLRPTSFLKNTLNPRIYDLIKKECLNTDYLTIAPVSYAFDMIVCFIEEGKDSEAFQKFSDRLKDVLFHGPQGMTVMGTNGTQVWDTAFMIQYYYLSGLNKLSKFHKTIERAFRFLVNSQFTEDCVDGSFRDKRKGAWPFSTKIQGYTVSDCTAEALKAVIMVRDDPQFAHIRNLISDKSLFDGINVLLGLQNLGRHEFGSFSTYENIRAPLLLEALNPAEVFNNIMVEYPYVECTDSCVLGLTYFHESYPEHRSEEIRYSIDNAIKYIKSVQNKNDGSWYGCWGVCFTYALMFALEALSTVGLSYTNSESVRRGCDFLISKQRPDGGWSETMKACETHTYVNGPDSYVVQTAWALIGLILADYPNKNPIKKGIQLLMKRQFPTGEWKYESIEGVFNHSCAIEYPSYKFLFPIKALGLYASKYGNDTVY